MPNDYKLVEVEESKMSDPALAGYNPSSSLIPPVAGEIKPMMGGSMVGGTDERDVKLFGQVYKIPNPISLNETDLNSNTNIQEIMRLLNFNMLSFDEKKKILQSLYDSNCTNETDLALSCGCDPVRKVIADLATLLLKKTAEKIELPTPVKRVDTAKKQVEISIRIPLEMIRVVMGSTNEIKPNETVSSNIGAKVPSIEVITENVEKGQQKEEEKPAIFNEMQTMFKTSSEKPAVSEQPVVLEQPEKEAVPEQTPVQVAPAVTLKPGGQEGNATAISFGGNHTRKLRLSKI